MEVLNGVVSKCMIGKSYVPASKTHIVYSNTGHLDYYGGEGNKIKKGWNSISTKKKIKLVKTLTKDLSTFSDLGFGFNFDDIHHNNNHHNSLIISQAAEVLLAQLKQLRTEEEKLKTKEKEEKKKNKCKNKNCESESSESESSDSECDMVVDMKRVEAKESKESCSSTEISSGICLDEEYSSNMILESTLNKDASIQVVNQKESYMGRRIEVCMGGKCKKLGAPALLQEFQKAIGNDGGVIGCCKCMGKCKTAPNVKVSTREDDSLRYPTNPLYIGVALEDVDLIVSTYFGEYNNGLRMSIASVAS